MAPDLWAGGWRDGAGQAQRREDGEEAVARMGDLCGAGLECVGVGGRLSACPNPVAGSSPEQL